MASGKCITWLAALIVAANLIIVAIVLLGGPSKPKPPPLPNPNGYDDFLKAARLLAISRPVSNSISHEDLHAIVAQNAPATEMTQQGLGRECRVPIAYSTNYASNHFGDLSRLKTLAIPLIYQGHLREIEG